MATGIRKRHSGDCPAKNGERCRCDAGWEASIYSSRDGRKIRKTFRRKSEAVSWRADAKAMLDKGSLKAPSAVTLRQAAEEWLAGIESGAIKNRDGNRFKPATLRGYRQSLETYVLPELGGERLSDIHAADIQHLIDRWEGESQEAATTRNAIKPLQSLYRRLRARGIVSENPTVALELPAPRPKQAEIVSPEDAQRLVALTPDQDRAIWATAIYAGLRYGELRALRWSAVDLAAGEVTVSESWDPKAGSIDPKTKTSRRQVPISGPLRDELANLKARAGDASPEARVFAKSDGSPFDAVSIYRRADTAWRRAELATVDEEAFQGLARRAGADGENRDEQTRAILRHPDLSKPDLSLRLHQARHTCASFWIAAGLDPKTVMTYMGHSSITVTYDLYGHLIPGSMDEDRAKLDAFLNRADTASRIRAISDLDAV